jgi:CheY-like chemotaxis protein
MNTISNGVYRPVQKLHPPSLLGQFIDQAASGCLKLSSGSSLWFLHLEQGQLIYASDLIDPFGRLERHLRRMTAQATALTSAVRVQVRLMFETPTADQQTQGSDYQAICWLVEQQHLTSQQAAELIEAMVREVIDAFLPIQTGSYELIQTDLLAEFPKFCQLDLRALLDQCQTQMRYRQTGLPPFSARQPEFTARTEGQSAGEPATSDPAIERLLSSRFRSFLPSDRLSHEPPSYPSPFSDPTQRRQLDWRQDSWQQDSRQQDSRQQDSRRQDWQSESHTEPEIDQPPGAAQPLETDHHSVQTPDPDQAYSSEAPEAVSAGGAELIQPVAESAPEYRSGYGSEYAQVEQPSGLSNATHSADTQGIDIDPELAFAEANSSPLLPEAIRDTAAAEFPFASPNADRETDRSGTPSEFGSRTYSSWTNRDRIRSERYDRRSRFDRSDSAAQDNSSPLQQQFRTLRTPPLQTPLQTPSPADSDLVAEPQTFTPPNSAPGQPEQLPPFSQLTQTASSGKTYTIACIDDSPTVLQAIKGFLDDKSLSVVLISDPVKALMQIIRTRPDLILLDVTMPNLDGYELCSLLRKHPGFRNTPIVMVTSSTGFIDRAKAKLVGSSGYLTKPFTQTDLLKIVFKHLN